MTRMSGERSQLSSGGKVARGNYIMIGGGGIVYVKVDPYAVSPWPLLPPPPAPFQTKLYTTRRIAAGRLWYLKISNVAYRSLITRCMTVVPSHLLPPVAEVGVGGRFFVYTECPDRARARARRFTRRSSRCAGRSPRACRRPRSRPGGGPPCWRRRRACWLARTRRQRSGGPGCRARRRRPLPTP